MKMDMEDLNLTDEQIDSKMRDLLGVLRANKPNDRSEKDRRFAITITDMEKLFAYFHTFVTTYIFTENIPTQDDNK
jgi:hypothetical protein